MSIIYDFEAIAKRLPNGRRFGSIDDEAPGAEKSDDGPVVCKKHVWHSSKGLPCPGCDTSDGRVSAVRRFNGSNQWIGLDGRVPDVAGKRFHTVNTFACAEHGHGISVSGNCPLCALSAANDHAVKLAALERAVVGRAVAFMDSDVLALGNAWRHDELRKAVADLLGARKKAESKG